MYWWSPVRSANASTRAWSIVSHGLTPSSFPTSSFSSATPRTTLDSGMDHLTPRLGQRHVEHALAVELGVAPERLVVLRPLEEEVQVELPGEADPAVHLDRVAADLARRLGDERLRDRGGDVAVLGLGVERPGRVVGRRVRVLDLVEHLGAHVLDGL